MDCTIISACPFPLDEKKPGLNPGVFKIPAANLAHQDIEILVIKGSTYPVYMDSDRGSMIIDEAPEKVADAVVKDFCSSHLGVDGSRMPAIFWVSGEYDKTDAKRIFAEQIIDAIKRQGEWFRRLVEMADDDWEKYHQHKFITDIQRYAGKALGLARPWIVKPESIRTQDCPGCASTVSGKAIKCPHCQTIINVQAWTDLQTSQQAAIQKAQGVAQTPVKP